MRGRRMQEQRLRFKAAVMAGHCGTYAAATDLELSQLSLLVLLDLDGCKQ